MIFAHIRVFGTWFEIYLGYYSTCLRLASWIWFEVHIGCFSICFDAYLDGYGTWFDVYLGTWLMHILEHT
jgi:hypothetical protein